MSRTLPRTAQILLAGLLTLALLPIATSAKLVGISGGEGGGVVPYAPRPMPTLGTVVTQSQQGVPSLWVVVTGPGGSFIAADMTDEHGVFSLGLPDIDGMEISVVGTPLIGIPISCGQHLLLVLP